MLLSVRRSNSGRLVRCPTGARRGAWLLILAALFPLACAPSVHTSGSGEPGSGEPGSSSWPNHLSGQSKSSTEYAFSRHGKAAALPTLCSFSNISSLDVRQTIKYARSVYGRAASHRALASGTRAFWSRLDLVWLDLLPPSLRNGCTYVAKGAKGMLRVWTARRAANDTECGKRCKTSRQHQRMADSNLSVFEAFGDMYYNEVVLARQPFIKRRYGHDDAPVTAIFFMDSISEASCVDNSGRFYNPPICEAFARSAHGKQEYGVGVPILRLRPQDWQQPFAVA